MGVKTFGSQPTPIATRENPMREKPCASLWSAAALCRGFSSAGSIRRRLPCRSLGEGRSSLRAVEVPQVSQPAVSQTSQSASLIFLQTIHKLLRSYPIVWTDVLTSYGTSAAADQPLAVFGALSFWWMGEHGNPRIDPSIHVFFQNDQLAFRFIEEIDFDFCAADATAALLTAAS
jgi:hypothetical protein